MTKLSEVAGSSQTARRIQVQNESVADVTPPPWTVRKKGQKLGG
jgi:hypothetical protein